MEDVRHKRLVLLTISCVVQSTIVKKTNRCPPKHGGHGLSIMAMTSMLEHVIADVNFVRARAPSAYLSHWAAALVKSYPASLTSR